MTSRPMDRAEVVVIGGGILGTSTAFWLTQMGVRDVVVLEKRTVASGATGKSAAYIRMHYANPWDAALAYESWKMYTNWSDVVGGEGSYTKTGFLMIVGPENVENLKKNVAMLQQIGVPTEVLMPDQLRDLLPDLAVDDVGAAAYEPGSGYGDGPTAATGFARRAVQSGARIRQGVEARSIQVQGGRVVGVETSEGPIATSIVVNATGAWAPAFTRCVGIELPIRVKRPVEAIIWRPPSMQLTVTIDAVVGTSFRPEGQNMVIVSGRSDDWGVDPDTYDPTVEMSIISEGVSRLVRRVPALADAGLVKGVAGIDGYSDDRHIILGHAPGIEGLILCVGASGTGFKIAPAVGKCMAELILHGAARTVDIRAFRLERFAENQPVVGPYEYGWLEGVGSKLV